MTFPSQRHCHRFSLDCARHALAMAAPLALLALNLVPGVAMGQHAGHDHQHHQHAVAAELGKGYTRAEARYGIPDVTLVDANGQRLAQRAALESGKPTMLNFIFTSCTAICPVMSATFSQVRRTLGTERVEFQMISISIDPEYDTPARLKEYAALHDAGPDWQMLTGNKEAILAVARAFDAWRGDKMNHTPTTFLRASADKPWLRLDGFASPAELVREYRGLVGAPMASLGK